MEPINIEPYLNYAFNFRFNEIKNAIEFRRGNEDQFKELTEFELNSVLRDVKANIDSKVKRMDLRDLLFSDFTEVYNPFREYFDSLPSWDNSQEDYIKALAESITVDSSEVENWHKWFRKWLIGVVATACDDSKVNQTCLILVGRQGVGKSTWLKKLVPLALMDYYYSGSINPGNKDTEIQLTENLLINLDELEYLLRRDMASLKEIITKPEIKIRRPYGAKSERMPHRASFMGSLNDMEFLKDSTGNRRFLCFNTTAIDTQHSIDMNMVYAQALSLFHSGEKFYFEDEEIGELEIHNERYKQTSLEEEILNGMFEPHITLGVAELQVPTEKLLELIYRENRLAGRLSAKYLGMALNKMNWPKKKIQGSRHWLLKRKTMVS